MAQELQAFDRYMQLVQSGMPFSQALQESGLSGLNLEQQKKLAAQQQQAGFEQLGGTLVGALGTKAITDVAQGQKALGGLREGLSNIGKEVSGLFGPSAPTGIGPVASGADYAAALEGVGQAATQTAGQAATVTPVAETGMFAPGSKLTQGLGGLGAAIGAYGAYKGIEAGDPMSAGLGGAGVAGGLATMGFALGPVGWAALIAAPVAGALINKNKVTTRERNKRQTENLLNMGFSKEQMQALGRMDPQGNIMFRPDTLSKEQKDAEARKWNEISRSDDPNVNPLRQASGIWGTEGMLSTYGPDYLNKMSEFDRYVAAASAIENGGGFYQKKGEILLKNQNAAKAAYEAAKANPELMAKYQQNYDIYKSTGKDVGIPKIETPEEKEAKERAKQIYTTYND